MLTVNDPHSILKETIKLSHARKCPNYQSVPQLFPSLSLPDEPAAEAKYR